MLKVAIFILFFNAVNHFAWAKESKVCGQVKVMDGVLKLNDNEKILVCGRGSEASGWHDIPLAQAELYLKSIMQNLGYLEPRFESAQGQLLIWLGPRTRIKRFKVSAPEVLHANKKRKVKNQPLTTDKLNEIEEWAKIQTQSQGYACAETEVTAQVWDHTVLVKTDLKGKKKFGSIQVSELSGLNPEVLKRYQPFQAGDWFDIRKTQIMASRLLGDGLFQSAYFTTKCQGDVAELTLESSVGKPRIFGFGFGASTEELPFVDVSFKNTRLDNMASSYRMSIHASPREMSWTGNSELYLFRGWDKTYLAPHFRVAKEMESKWETNSARAGVNIGQNWDWWDMRFNARWGPMINYTKTLKGLGPADTTYPTMEGALAITSHIYEYLVRDQYEGWVFYLNYRGQNKGLGSQLDMNRYRSELKSLWNLGGFSPPQFVLGTRIESIVVDANDINRDLNRDLLPIEDRIFAGGDQNLRGFSRNSIDNAGFGYLNSLYLGFELRLIEELPHKLQPFLLWDVMKLGNQRYTLDSPTFFSEGVGIRWASPFGTFRGSAAKGRIVDEDVSTHIYKQGWVYFVSFGQEF